MYTQKQKDLFKQVVGKDLVGNKVYWDCISSDQALSEEFIEQFQGKVNWNLVSKYQTLSEEFIEQFQGKVNWNLVSRNQTLSEEFIERFQDKVNWARISKYQTLSEELIERFQDKVYWGWISKYQTLSEEFRDKFDLNKPDPKNNWIEASVEEKLPKVRETSFKIKEDEQGKYIEAYKAVRDNLSSVFQPGLVYEIGETYQAHCDCCLDTKNSFGLSGWTKNQAKDYHDGRLLRVKIYVEDIGAIVHDGDKIRCFKQTILEEV